MHSHTVKKRKIILSHIDKGSPCHWLCLSRGLSSDNTVAQLGGFAQRETGWIPCGMRKGKRGSWFQVHIHNSHLTGCGRVFTAQQQYSGMQSGEGGECWWASSWIAQWPCIETVLLSLCMSVLKGSITYMIYYIRVFQPHARGRFWCQRFLYCFV